MTKVDVELYEFLKEHEVHLCEGSSGIEMHVFVEFYELDDFVRIAGPEFFCVEGPKAVMKEECLSIDLTEIMEWRGEYISSYLRCVNDSSEVEMYRSELEYEDE